VRFPLVNKESWGLGAIFIKEDVDEGGDDGGGGGSSDSPAAAVATAFCLIFFANIIPPRSSPIDFRSFFFFVFWRISFMAGVSFVVPWSNVNKFQSQSLILLGFKLFSFPSPPSYTKLENFLINLVYVMNSAR